MLDWNSLVRDIDAARTAQVPALNIAIYVVKMMASSGDVERFSSLPLDVKTEVESIVATFVEKDICTIASSEGIEDISTEVRIVAGLLR